MTKRNKYVNKLIKTSDGLKNKVGKLRAEAMKYKKEATAANDTSLALKQKME